MQSSLHRGPPCLRSRLLAVLRNLVGPRTDFICLPRTSLAFSLSYVGLTSRLPYVQHCLGRHHYYLGLSHQSGSYVFGWHFILPYKPQVPPPPLPLLLPLNRLACPPAPFRSLPSSVRAPRPSLDLPNRRPTAQITSPGTSARNRREREKKRGRLTWKRPVCLSTHKPAVLPPPHHGR